MCFFAFARGKKRKKKHAATQSRNTIKKSGGIFGGGGPEKASNDARALHVHRQQACEPQTATGGERQVQFRNTGLLHLRRQRPVISTSGQAAEGREKIVKTKKICAHDHLTLTLLGCYASSPYRSARHAQSRMEDSSLTCPSVRRVHIPHSQPTISRMSPPNTQFARKGPFSPLTPIATVP